jgi:energy-coupling factor transport system substrate-specific component
MSWQLGAFFVLGLALAGGFAWYERTRPDARIIALVATLAAFAALGRIAFAAVPNVKPTTDIVLIAGYALGGGPGFVVGAVAGLSSNFFFGQGPWTPWQMAAWGAAGLIGAGLARLTRGRVGRWPLAIVCFVVGFAFTAIQDVGDWFTYSDHSGAQLVAYVGKGLGFDLVHAVGCLLFALAFGPALLHSIERFSRRLEVRWLPAGPVLPVLLVLAIGMPAALLASQPGGWGRSGAWGGGAGVAEAAVSPAQYLLAAQNRDGGFGPAPGQASAQLYAGWSALGLAAAGYHPSTVTHGGASLLDYVRSAAPGDPGTLERTILVARAAGASVTDFGGRDLLAELNRDIRRDGSVADQVNWTSFAVLALRAAGAVPSARTLAWLGRQQDSDGGFNFATAGGQSDVDDTGAALEALAGDPGAHAVIARAVRFIRRQQNSDGGFPSQPGATSNAQSTSFGTQGLLAAAVPLGSMPHGSPDRYLTSLIASDGHIRYSRQLDQTPVWVTGEALMALSGKPLPLSPPPAQAAPPARRHHAPRVIRHRHAPVHTRRRPHRHRANRHASRADLGAFAPALALVTVPALALVTALALAPVGG